MKSTYTNPQSGKITNFDYSDAISFDHLNLHLVKQVYGVCFINNQIVLVKANNNWSLPGGTPESGETIEQTLRREIIEETNMEITHWKPIGIQKVFEEGLEMYYQLRVTCQVRPRGPFISDPDGDVTEIIFINPLDYKQYFDWGDISDRIIYRSLEVWNHK